MRHPIVRILSLLAVAALADCTGMPLDCPGCTGPTSQPPQLPDDVVAHVSAIYDGTNAFVGSSRAAVNQPIHLNEHFFTGSGTKMEVSIDGIGTVLLDQNTDPNLFKTAKCFWIRLTSGMMTVNNTSTVCVDNTGGGKFTQHSYVLYAAQGGRLTVAVFEGQVTTIEPPGYTINGGQIFLLQGGKPVGPPRQISRDTINRLQAWIPRTIL